MKKTTKSILLIAGLAIGAPYTMSGNYLVASTINYGDLVVVQAGDGTAALSSAATASFLKEFTTSGGSPVQTIALPTAASGNNAPLTLSGSATSEGFLTLSQNQQYLTMMGYSAAPGTAGVATAAPTAIPRVLGRIDLSGNIDTSNFYNATGDAFNGSNPRSAVSTDGTSVWMAGNAGSGLGASAGVRYTSFVANNGSANTSTQINSTSSNMRVVNIFNGQLYVSSSTGTLLGVSTVGTGLPTTGFVGSPTLLSGFPTSGTHSPYDFVFEDANTLYVADDGAAASGGGIQKWTQSGGTWTLAYTLLNNGTATTSVRGLAGYFDGTNEVLFATTNASSANNLISITDTGATATATILATAPTNTAFRGVEYLVPEPASLVTMCLGACALGLFGLRRKLA